MFRGNGAQGADNFSHQRMVVEPAWMQRGAWTEAVVHSFMIDGLVGL
jgi:hypothetical protein